MNKTIYTFTEEWEDAFVFDEEENEIQEIKITLLINKEDMKQIETEMHKAYDNWMYEECENSILIDDETTNADLCQICIGDYILMWLNKLNIEYTDVEEEQRQCYKCHEIIENDISFCPICGACVS